MRAAFPILLPRAVALCLVLAACSDDSAPVAAKPSPPIHAVAVRILALGDSYTSGEAVPAPKSWPRQLEPALLEDSIRVTDLAVIAHTGWTTSDLLDTLESRTDTTTYDLVTLQIGV